MKSLVMTVLMFLTLPVGTKAQESQKVFTPEEQTIVDLSNKKWNWMAEKSVEKLAELFHENSQFVHMGGYWGKQEELNTNDIFVDTRIQMEEKLAKGRYFCMLYQYSDTISQQKALYENDPDSIYMAVEGPRNSNGDDPTLPTNNMNGWTLTLISKNCKYPERAIAFMDYMMSEHGQMLIYLGVEGVTYDIVDGKPVLKEDVSKILNSDRETYDRLYGADDAYWMLKEYGTAVKRYEIGRAHV